MFRSQNTVQPMNPAANASTGMRLRQLRENMGLTIRDVESASQRIAARTGKPEYCIPLSRLSDIESKNVVPGIHKLCSLALIYRRPLNQLLSFFEIDVPALAVELNHELPCPRTQYIAPELPRMVELPLMDPGFNPQRTAPLLRHVQKWGLLPAAQLKRMAQKEYRYALIGMNDRMMYPLLRPGTLVQIDPRVTQLSNEGWNNEYERPIYFVETRDGYFCCWVSGISPDRIVLQPHSLSPSAPKVMRSPQDAEIAGRVVGFAMRLDEPGPEEPAAFPQ
jgi:transcriptional regulator with XRE-family HTH domain